jgi:4-carboxymuconolactone decarboxylase
MTEVTQVNNSLSSKERALIPIAAFTASGDLENLSLSLNKGLDIGLTINQIKSLLVQMYAYCGFPRSLNALATFMAVVNQRRENGADDSEGDTPFPKGDDWNSLTFGAKTQMQLLGQEVSGPLFDFAPEIDEYLKAHLFGDIFANNVLTWRERELATISALASMYTVNSQLKSHYMISMNNQISPNELKNFIKVIYQTCDQRIAKNAEHVLNNILI